jgi:protein RecA
VAERYRPQAEPVRAKPPAPAKVVKSTKSKPTPQPKSNGIYLKESSLQFVPTGCDLLDCAIGGGGEIQGGYPLGRIVNIVGDKSTGKTLCAIEASANFARCYPKGFIWYREAEAAFDTSYAAQLGLPVGQVDFGPEGTDSNWGTIEAIFDDLHNCLDKAEEAGQPGLYIIDSLDAVTSEAELKYSEKSRKLRAADTDDPRKGTYGLEKQKQLSRLFRELIRRVKRSRVCVIFISQIRDKIDASFGKKYDRTGGKSLDFYASVVLYLAYIEQVTKEVNKVRRAIGVVIKVKVEKNKIALPYRDCEFAIRFGYGIDNEAASVEWLKKVRRLEDAGLPEKVKYGELDRAKLTADIHRIWADVERGFAPEQRKYA